jgi:hypothetical protein
MHSSRDRSLRKLLQPWQLERELRHHVHACTVRTLTKATAAATVCVLCCTLHLLYVQQVVDDDGLGYCDDGEEYLDRQSGDKQEDVSTSMPALHAKPCSNMHHSSIPC